MPIFILKHFIDWFTDTEIALLLAVNFYTNTDKNLPVMIHVAAAFNPKLRAFFLNGLRFFSELLQSYFLA